jgi:hypothetical protein
MLSEVRWAPSRSAALAVVLASVYSASVGSEVLERVLAVVDGRPLMLSEAILVSRVQGVAQKEALERAIDQRLMYAEAVRLPQAAPTAEEADRAFLSLRARAGARLDGLDEGELRALARREAVILKYARIRFGPQIRATGDAADRALGEKIEAWIRELRSAAEIRYNPEDGS